MKIAVVGAKPSFWKETGLVRKALKRLGPILKLKNRQLEIYLVGNEFMKKNVLVFPAPQNFPRPDLRNQESLGEIYLNPQYIRKSKEDFVLMLVHGLLHLLGYDHKKNNDRIKMDKKEKQLCQAIKSSL